MIYALLLYDKGFFWDLQKSMGKIFSFEVLSTDGKARCGRITTDRGTIDTPVFMPVGTAGTVKALLSDNVQSTGASIILSNTYHLMVRPGIDCIESLGGLHRFMNWNLPILTDSGGFQVMSLASLRKVTEDGVIFRSHINGEKLFMSPENSVMAQRRMGVDISMAFDECIAYPASREDTEKSMQLSMRWARRSRDAFEGSLPGQALFGIQQGGMFTDLRQKSSDALQKIGFEGYAIGGLAVGEGHDNMIRMLDECVGMLPYNKPRYLMGIGTPKDIIASVLRGVDMFDCVHPTRLGRHGQAFTSRGGVTIRNSVYARDGAPLDLSCDCLCCTQYSRAYLHHLFKAREITPIILLSWHNIHFLQNLMKNLRISIEKGSLQHFISDFMQLQKEGR